MNPTITIVTACRNAQATLERAVRSVLGQTWPGVEYLVIDGASTDGTLDILERYRDRITLVSEPDDGVYFALNKALRIARGDWILFLGADDYLLTPSTLEEAAGKMTDPDAVYYGDVYCGSEDKRLWGEVSRHTVMRKFICHQGIFYPRSAYRSLEYDTRYQICADRVYNITLMSRGVPFRYLDQVISFYSEGGLSAHASDPVYQKDELRLAWKLGPLSFLDLTSHRIHFHIREYLRRHRFFAPASSSNKAE